MTSEAPAQPAARSRAPQVTALVGVLTLALATVVVLVAARSGAPVTAVGPGRATVHIAIEHSRFLTERVDVRPGTVVTFVVENRDPINHELIVGDEAVHARHRDGKEAAHPPVPGEVSVGPGETATTLYRFEDRGVVTFACHLPGHLAYGMEGAVVVR